MTFFSQSVERVSVFPVTFVHHFEFSLKTADLAAQLRLAPMICPKGEDLAPLYRQFINCLLKHGEIWKTGQFKNKSCSDILE